MISYNGEEFVRFTGFAYIYPKELAAYRNLKVGDVYRVEKVYPASNSLIILNGEAERVLVKFNEVELP